MNEGFDQNQQPNTESQEPLQETPPHEDMPPADVQPNLGYPYEAHDAYAAGETPRKTAPVMQENPQVIYTGEDPAQAHKKAVQTKGGKHRKGGLAVLYVLVSLCLVLSIVLSVLFFTRDDRPVKKEPQQNEVVKGGAADIHETPKADDTDSTGALTAKGVYERIKESSVGVLVYQNSTYNNRELAGQGSGIIIDEDPSKTYTYILTCAHVIDGGGTVKVQLYDETQLDAVVVGLDTKTDVGVLRIRANGLKIAELGDSNALSVGESVYAIGNPGGVQFAGSFTNGIVSAISRPVDSNIGYVMECIQHTAAINPGNSGGALVNASGQVIGMNSSKIAAQHYEGMGFAVPSRTLQEVLTEILAHGYVTGRPLLGVRCFAASENQMYTMIVSANHLPTGSLVIHEITAESSLNGLNVQPGDMIIRVNGKDLTSKNDLADLVEASDVGDTIKLTICRVDKSDYTIETFDIEAKLVEDRSQVQSGSATQQGFYNPFEQNGQ